MRERDKRREELVAEYLASDMSYREMEERYGVSSSTLQRWVAAVAGKAAGKLTGRAGAERTAAAGEAATGEAAGEAGERGKEKEAAAGEVATGNSPPVAEAAGVPGSNPASEIKRLRAELRKAELHNKLLNAMIDIAEEQFEIPIRKKRGAGR